VNVKAAEGSETDDRAEPSDDVPLPLRTIARILGIDRERDAPTKWLHRRLADYQREIRETLLIGNGKSGSAARYRVTLRDARRACAGHLTEAPTAREAQRRVERMLAGIRGDVQGWLGDALENLRSLSGP
jgi:hypothetical protein